MQIRVYVRSESNGDVTLHPTMTDATENLEPFDPSSDIFFDADNETIYSVKMKLIEVNEFEPVE